MAIYADIASEYPDRIEKIYIRRTFKNLSTGKTQQLQQLQQLPVPVKYFTDNDNLLEDLEMIDKYNHKS